FPEQNFISIYPTLSPAISKTYENIFIDLNDSLSQQILSQNVTLNNTVHIKSTIIIPAYISVTICPGTKLYFSTNSQIIVLGHFFYNSSQSILKSVMIARASHFIAEDIMLINSHFYLIDNMVLNKVSLDRVSLNDTVFLNKPLLTLINNSMVNVEIFNFSTFETKNWQKSLLEINFLNGNANVSAEWKNNQFQEYEFKSIDQSLMLNMTFTGNNFNKSTFKLSKFNQILFDQDKIFNCSFNLEVKSVLFYNNLIQHSTSAITSTLVSWSPKFHFFNNTVANISSYCFITLKNSLNILNPNLEIKIKFNKFLDPMAKYVIKALLHRSGIQGNMSTVDARYSFWNEDKPLQVRRRVYDYFYSRGLMDLPTYPFYTDVNMTNLHQEQSQFMHGRHIGGELVHDLELGADNFTVVRDIIIHANACLTLGAGAVLHFEDTYKVMVNGALVINGTQDKRVTFNFFADFFILEFGLIIFNDDKSNLDSQVDYLNFNLDCSFIKAVILVKSNRIDLVKNVNLKSSKKIPLFADLRSGQNFFTMVNLSIQSVDCTASWNNTLGNLYIRNVNSTAFFDVQCSNLFVYDSHFYDLKIDSRSNNTPNGLHMHHSFLTASSYQTFDLFSTNVSFHHNTLTNVLFSIRGHSSTNFSFESNKIFIHSANDAKLIYFDPLPFKNTFYKLDVIDNHFYINNSRLFLIKSWQDISIKNLEMKINISNNQIECWHVDTMPNITIEYQGIWPFKFDFTMVNNVFSNEPKIKYVSPFIVLNQIDRIKISENVFDMDFSSVKNFSICPFNIKSSNSRVHLISNCTHNYFGLDQNLLLNTCVEPTSSLFVRFHPIYSQANKTTLFNHNRINHMMIKETFQKYPLLPTIHLYSKQRRVFIREQILYSYPKSYSLDESYLGCYLYSYSFGEY
ncbi:hypothetical protein BpHYR1_010213, partial [Brachionus plicatilis]